jgi:hypothetical protein
MGFAQGLYALDAADGETEHASAVSILISFGGLVLVC